MDRIVRLLVVVNLVLAGLALSVGLGELSRDPAAGVPRQPVAAATARAEVASAHVLAAPEPDRF
ncbi:MAG: hypothetical protein ACQGVK_25020 [Myxococcota bacterium]